MIQCRVCKEYFHPDDIVTCSDGDFCEDCYSERGLNKKLEFEEEKKDQVVEIPRTCPECKNFLELQMEPDGGMSVFCSSCDFIQQLTPQQIEDLESQGYL